MLTCFTHPGSASVHRAFAVWRIMCNEADPSQWRVLDRWVAESGLEEVLKNIKQIIETNGSPNPLDEELNWWQEQLHVSLS